MPRQKLQISDLLIRDSKSKNPFAASPDQGALQNMVPDLGVLKRVPFLPPFHSSASSSRVWHIVDFQFQRDNARNQQVLIFKADGKVYKRQAGAELEVFPGKTSFAAFTQKPSVVNLADRLHVSDGSQYLIYDGWDWFVGGLVAPAAPSTSLVAGSLTGTYKVAVTAVHIRNGVRIHESSRSSVVSNAPSAQNIRVTKPTLDSRATHWSVYVSELSTSDVYRRSVTVDANTTTTDISSVPTSSAPIAPIRNDPVQPSQVFAGWKNRIAMRDEQAKSNLWFTAFAEVKGLLNGAPEECLPGRGSASISDLVNEWTLPDSGEPIQSCVWHEEYLWAFSDRNGYLIRGEGSLLDNRGIRDFFPMHLFTFGAASPWSTLSSPFGLVVLTPDAKLWLWQGSGETIDIGRDIQGQLNSLSQTQLNELEMTYWEGGGNTWLLVPLADRIAVFDFSIRTEDSPQGIWFSIITNSPPTAFANMGLSGMNVALVGLADGTVLKLDDSSAKAITVNQPAHVGLSMILPHTYLGSTVQNSLTGLARTGSYPPNRTGWAEGHFLEIFHKGTGDTDATGIRPAVPTLNVYYDDTNPTSPDGPVAQTASAVSGSSEKRAWLKQSPTSSGAGAVAKRFQFEVQFTTTTNDGAVRPQCVNDEVWQLSFSWTPRTDLML